MPINYTPGQFYPALASAEGWYRCHPAFGMLPLRKDYGLDDCLNNLGDSHPWNRADEEKQDDLVEKYIKELVAWFTASHHQQLICYFSGGFESRDASILNELGIDTVFSGQWQEKYMQLLAKVNFHEFVLQSNELTLLAYESWDNLMINLRPSEMPEEFTSSWL